VRIETAKSISEGRIRGAIMVYRRILAPERTGTNGTAGNCPKTIYLEDILLPLGFSA
jgi:hypothetical protein